ncbi:MAG: 7-cyano-7-deazaguanine synthase QueC [Erysipelotrichaceae bacterium]|nr:7-cyano-7-deazaguanine synthase QueC [Erysipelotrichaceae bacterium]MDD3809683.1 7-cyano-7-deazaguanine synthase QueC [Erysipelotrichaceae bacterium]
MTKVMVLSSGGIDSTTCLALAIEKYGKENVISLSIWYGQKHDREITAAANVAAYYQIEHRQLDLTPIFKNSDCSLLKGSTQEIPEESYATQLAKAEGKPVSTYVPFRNGLFLSSAASLAIIDGCSIIYYGAHQDDASGDAYPDCSDAFNQAMNQAIYLGSGKQVHIEAPFVANTKEEVVKLGLELNAPYHLTYSCYQGGQIPCGKCGTCIQRAQAFSANNAIDPALKGETNESV